MGNILSGEASVVIGGEAGDGVRASGEVLGRIFNRHGHHTFVRDDYQSLIRGGHNFCQIRASSKIIRSHEDYADLVVALDQRSIRKHESRLNEDGKLIFDSDDLDYSSDKGYGMPLSSMVEEVGGVDIMRNSAVIGAISYFYGLNLQIVKGVMEQAYGGRAEENVKLAERGYDHAQESFERIQDMGEKDRGDAPLLTGNQAISLGAAGAGLNVYLAYPMTPSTSILHFLAGNEDELDLTVVQPENEIGVINMALGSAYAGSRTMIASSGGGYSLMQEAVSLAGMSETPILIVECQRAGPSTGVPTYTAQSDLDLALNSGHGEFPRIVLAPGDPEEAFYRSGEALNLAWQHQVPVILLSDKHLSESRMTSPINPDEVGPEEPKLAENPSEDYERYEITEDGVSPLAFPGTQDVMVKNTSYEHIESGYTTEDPEEIARMQEKRKRKLKGIEEDVLGREPVKVYGDEGAGNLIVGWGSTKGAILEAIDLLDESLKFVQPVYLRPFPSEEVSNHIDSADLTIAVENNVTGQLAQLIGKETLREVDEKVLKFDARPYTPRDLAERLKEVL